MSEDQSTFTTESRRSGSRKCKQNVKNISNKTLTNPKEDASTVSQSTSHTQFFKWERNEKFYEKITTNEYFGSSESMTGSSDTYRCVHGPTGKVYTEKGLLKRNLRKLDKVPAEPKWTQRCKPAYDSDIIEHLVFLVKDPTVGQQKERLIMLVKDFAIISNNGFEIDKLDEVCAIFDFLIESLPRNPDLKEYTIRLLQNIGKPILLNKSCDIVTYFQNFSNYLGFLGYLLMRVEDDSMFDIVSEGLIWHLSAPDHIRNQDNTKRCLTLIAAAPQLYQSIARMISVATSHRFPTFLIIALLLACHSSDNCLELLKENIIENIFYRFNPYFPDRKLPITDINPADPQDFNLKLGDSSINMSNVLSLLLVLLKTTSDKLNKNPKYTLLLPCPDKYSQRCFIWAYRYECRAREHRHQRNTLTCIGMTLIHCFGNRLESFSELLMMDIMTLSVMTELPPRNDWTSTVNFNTAQQDVNFKQLLIYFSTNLLRVFPLNKFMVESRYWLLGLMYLLDPGLCSLRARWSQALFADLRKAALQALVVAVPRIAPNLVKEYGLVRRMMWYIEWYSESPYEMPILYWCVRLLQVTVFHRGDPTRQISMEAMFETHGLVILTHLCYTLLDQKTPPPPVEKAQTVIGLCLRLLTSAVEIKGKISCCVYPAIKWPSVVNSLAATLMDMVLYSKDKHYIVCDRLMISLLNFIWEAIIWKKSNREKFIAKDGIYKLLDIITMTQAPVQCLALALVCDATKAGDAVGQLVTWRANLGADAAHPNVVKRGATIATLLATIFRDECLKTGVRLNHNSIIKDLETPIMSTEVRKQLYSPNFGEASIQNSVCLAAADLAGSRMSKVFALLHMLSEDLDSKVCLADEAYNLYKNVLLEPDDECMLVLCAHYLTLKLNEAWIETKVQSTGFLPNDVDILEEFLHIGKGWAKNVKRQQNDVLQAHRKKDGDEESSLYEFLGRVRLNIALDALRDVRCVARSADRARMTHALLQDAVRAHHRRSISGKALQAPVLRTYGPTLDDQNITGHNVKVYSIHPKDKPKSLNVMPTS